MGNLLELKRLLQTFRNALEPKFRFHPIHHNILPHQRRTILFISKNPKLMVVQTENGLGPGAIYPKEYFRFAIKHHLGDTWTYRHLTPATAAYCANSMGKLLKKCIKKYLDVMIKEERKFLRTNLRSSEGPWGYLYILLKVHKVPLKTCPVVTYYGNPLHHLGQIIKEWLQPLDIMQKS